VHAAPKATCRKTRGQSLLARIAATRAANTTPTIGSPLRGTIWKSGGAGGTPGVPVWMVDTDGCTAARSVIFWGSEPQKCCHRVGRARLRESGVVAKRWRPVFLSAGPAPTHPPTGRRRMTRYVAFLRGMNLGKRRLEMSRLKSLFVELGFEDVDTFIASGNVIFSTPERVAKKLESRIAAHLELSLGYDVDTFVRTVDEVVAIARSKPFADDGNDGITIHVGFLQDALSSATAKALTAVRTPDDEFLAKGREYYWLCRIRTSDSKVWTSPDVKALKLPTSTMRNMSSVRKLVAKHGSDGAAQRGR